MREKQRVILRQLFALDLQNTLSKHTISQKIMRKIQSSSFSSLGEKTVPWKTRVSQVFFVGDFIKVLLSEQAEGTGGERELRTISTWLFFARAKD